MRSHFLLLFKLEGTSLETMQPFCNQLLPSKRLQKLLAILPKQKLTSPALLYA
jgi:hypothetical protein